MDSSREVSTRQTPARRVSCIEIFSQDVDSMDLEAFRSRRISLKEDIIMDEEVETYSEEIVSENKQFIIIGVVDPRKDGALVSMYKAIEDGLIDESNGVYVNLVTKERISIDIAMATELIKAELIDSNRSQDYIQSYILAKTEAKIDLTNKEIVSLVDTKEKKMVNLEEARRKEIVDRDLDVFMDTELQEAKPVKAAIEQGLMLVRDADSLNTLSMFMAESIVCSKTGDSISVQKALDNGVLESVYGPYVNLKNKFKISLYDALCCGLIKLKNTSLFDRHNYLIIDYPQEKFSSSKQVLEFFSYQSKSNIFILTMLQNAKLFHQMFAVKDKFVGIPKLCELELYRNQPLMLRVHRHEDFQSPLVLHQFLSTEHLDLLINEYNKWTTRSVSVTNNAGVLRYDDLTKLSVRVNPQQQYSTFLIRFHDLAVVSLAFALQEDKHFFYFSNMDLDSLKFRFRLLTQLKSSRSNTNFNQRIYLTVSPTNKVVSSTFDVLFLNGFLDCSSFQFRFKDFDFLTFSEGHRSFDSIKDLVGLLNPSLYKLCLGAYFEAKIIDQKTGIFQHQESGEKYPLLVAASQKMINLSYVYLIYNDKLTTLKEILEQGCLETSSCQFYHPKKKRYYPMDEAIEEGLIDPWISQRTLEIAMLTGSKYQAAEKEKQLNQLLSDLKSVTKILRGKLEYLQKYKFHFASFDDAHKINEVSRTLFEETEPLLKNAETHEVDAIKILSSWEGKRTESKVEIENEVELLKDYVNKIGAFFRTKLTELDEIEQLSSGLSNQSSDLKAKLSKIDKSMHSLTLTGQDSLVSQTHSIQAMSNEHSNLSAQFKQISSLSDSLVSKAQSLSPSGSLGLCRDVQRNLDTLRDKYKTQAEQLHRLSDQMSHLEEKIEKLKFQLSDFSQSLMKDIEMAYKIPVHDMQARTDQYNAIDSKLTQLKNLEEQMNRSGIPNKFAKEGREDMATNAKKRGEKILSELSADIDIFNENTKTWNQLLLKHNDWINSVNDLLSQPLSPSSSPAVIQKKLLEAEELKKKLQTLLDKCTAEPVLKDIKEKCQEILGSLSSASETLQHVLYEDEAAKNQSKILTKKLNDLNSKIGAKKKELLQVISESGKTPQVLRMKEIMRGVEQLKDKGHELDDSDLRDSNDTANKELMKTFKNDCQELEKEASQSIINACSSSLDENDARIKKISGDFQQIRDGSVAHARQIKTLEGMEKGLNEVLSSLSDTKATLANSWGLVDERRKDALEMLCFVQLNKATDLTQKILDHQDKLQSDIKLKAKLQDKFQEASKKLRAVESKIDQLKSRPLESPEENLSCLHELEFDHKVVADQVDLLGSFQQDLDDRDPEKKQLQQEFQDLVEDSDLVLLKLRKGVEDAKKQLDESASTTLKSVHRKLKNIEDELLWQDVQDVSVPALQKTLDNFDVFDGDLRQAQKELNKIATEMNELQGRLSSNRNSIDENLDAMSLNDMTNLMENSNAQLLLIESQTLLDELKDELPRKKEDIEKILQGAEGFENDVDNLSIALNSLEYRNSTINDEMKTAEAPESFERLLTKKKNIMDCIKGLHDEDFQRVKDSADVLKKLLPPKNHFQIDEKVIDIEDDLEERTNDISDSINDLEDINWLSGRFGKKRECEKLSNESSSVEYDLENLRFECDDLLRLTHKSNSLTISKWETAWQT